MKKIILTLSLVICALLVIWGCTKSSNNNETTTQTKTSTSTTTTAKAETTDNDTTNVADTSVQADDMGADGMGSRQGRKSSAADRPRNAQLSIQKSRRTLYS